MKFSSAVCTTWMKNSSSKHSIQGSATSNGRTSFDMSAVFNKIISNYRNNTTTSTGIIISLQTPYKIQDMVHFSAALRVLAVVKEQKMKINGNFEVKYVSVHSLKFASRQKKTTFHQVIWGHRVQTDVYWKCWPQAIFKPNMNVVNPAPIKSHYYLIN